MISTAITDLWYGFGVALEPHNLMYCFLGVLVGNLVGVLPGMGPVATISILLPLTFGMQPVPAILMLSGVYYGAQYGGAICSILLNLPCHPPHAVTCLDGFPLTKQGKGGTALGITIIAAFVGASFGITEMIFLAPFLVKVALEFGPAEVCSLMLVGLLAGSTLAKGSPLKGIAMTVLGLLVGIVGSDIETGQPRFTFGTHVQIDLHRAVFTRENAMAIAADYDVIIDGTDNFPTRYLSNDVAVFLKKPNVYGSILRFEGQCSVFAPHLGGPCYRCMAPQPPAPGLVPSCAEGGVLGVLPGLIGTMQATEAIKLITGIGQPLVGRLLHVDTLSMKFRTFNLRRDPECPVCGDHPTITELIDYQGFCGLPSENQPTMSSPSTSDVPAITVKDLQTMQASGENFFLLDVREPYEFEIARIPGSTLIPLGQLADRLEEVPQDQKVVIHCRSGMRSAKALGLLQQEGYKDLWNVTGGILAWSDEVDPSVPTY